VKTHNQIDHVLIGKRRNSSVLDIRTFRAEDCDTNHYLRLKKVKERLAVNKQRSRRYHKISAKESLVYYELKKYKPWFDEAFSELLDQGNKSNCSG
jgi:hypothetical protein